MATNANDPVLDLLSEPIDGINMEGVGSGINMNGAAIKNLATPVDPDDAVRLADVIAASVPVGLGPLPWAGSEGTVPADWLLCDGTIYNIIDYPALHTILQNTYGGDNVITFGVPDLRGRIPLGKDDMGGAAASVVPAATPEGAVGGSEIHALTVLEMPSHVHTASAATAGGHTHTGTTDLTGDHVHPRGVLTYNGNQGGGGTNAARDAGNTGNAGAHAHIVTINPVSDHTHTLTIDPVGNGDAHNNLQPYIVVNYIIKAL